MCYVGGGDVSLARWEMNKPVCVRSGVREEKCRREMSAAGGIGLWGTGDHSPADTHKIHKAQMEPEAQKKITIFSLKTHL